MPNEVVTSAIDRLADRQDLTADQAAAVLAEIMAGSTSEAQIAAFLIALRTKGETKAEIVGLVRTMRDLAVKVELPDQDLLDTAGTGGGRSTFNVSTAAALVAAGAGARVAKHGNRSATSRCGSADVLEALGVKIDLGPEAVAECIRSVGFGFMFAPKHHAATRFVVPVRKELAVRTVFNLLGPLTNPAAARYQLIGVSDPNYLQTLAEALLELGVERAMVVSSSDGLDEISPSATTDVAEVSGGEIRSYTVEPAELGIEPIDLDQIGGGSPDENAILIRDLLAGKAVAGVDLVLINAAAALYTCNRAEDLEAGLTLARESIDSGAALTVLESFIDKTSELTRMSS